MPRTSSRPLPGRSKPGDYFPAKVLDEFTSSLGVGDRDRDIINTGGLHGLELLDDLWPVVSGLFELRFASSGVGRMLYSQQNSVGAGR